jgi:hypothetical protein
MGLLPVGILVLIAFEEDSQLWRLPVLGYALLGWVVAAWVWWGEVEDPKGRRWFAATEGGLLAWQPDSGASSAIPWDELHVEPYRAGVNGRKRTLIVPLKVSGRTELFRAAVRGRPSSPLSARRLAGITAFWLVTGGFTALPIALTVDM